MTKRYYPLPLYYEKTFVYSDVNKDPDLRDSVVNYFYDMFKNNNKYNLTNEDLKKKIYKKVRKLIKLTNMNWYDIKLYEKVIIKLFTEKVNN